MAGRWRRSRIFSVKSPSVEASVFSFSLFAGLSNRLECHCVSEEIQTDGDKTALLENLHAGQGGSAVEDIKSTLTNTIGNAPFI